MKNLHLQAWYRSGTAHNTSTWEHKTGRSRIQDQLGVQKQKYKVCLQRTEQPTLIRNWPVLPFAFPGAPGNWCFWLKKDHLATQNVSHPQAVTGGKDSQALRMRAGHGWLLYLEHVTPKGLISPLSGPCWDARTHYLDHGFHFHKVRLTPTIPQGCPSSQWHSAEASLSKWLGPINDPCYYISHPEGQMRPYGATGSSAFLALYWHQAHNKPQGR